MKLILADKQAPRTREHHASPPLCERLLLVDRVQDTFPRRGRAKFRATIRDKVDGCNIATGESRSSVNRAIQNAVDLLRDRVDELDRERKELLAIIRKVDRFAKNKFEVELQENELCST